MHNVYYDQICLFYTSSFDLQILGMITKFMSYIRKYFLVEAVQDTVLKSGISTAYFLPHKVSSTQTNILLSVSLSFLQVWFGDQLFQQQTNNKTCLLLSRKLC